ncbi:cholesteryl ester transfer protein isoform X4 [Podarcis raffonei]|uniref:cholesteryl ester transfer protein isoform X4 n=1 Tax=Podarcis raffonei TaxID=65483 RepID=UPI00232907BF|nr:cholesteryl ester transfer protein isoform X4 [Podarcis raffonei]
MARILIMLVSLLSSSLVCSAEPSSYSDTSVVFRMTKPAVLVLNEKTAHVVQTAFQHADYPDIKGEKSVRFLGKIAYGLKNIHIGELTIENTTVDLKEDDAINIGIQNVSASFQGTLSYGYVGGWLVKLIHSIDFEIESSIDLQINVKLLSDDGRVIVDTSDCYLTFHKLTLHLQGDKDPGWLKQLFTNFISFTLKLVLKNQVCKEINYISQLLADYVHETSANFLKDGDIGVDISVTASLAIKANYIESYHKEMFEIEELKTQQEIVQKIFRGASYNDSLAKVWSLDPPQIILQPEGTIVKSSVAVELSVPLQGEGPPSVALYFEKEVTVTVQASYMQKNLYLHHSEAMIEIKKLKRAAHIAVNDETLMHILEKIVSVAGIPEVVSRTLNSPDGLWLPTPFACRVSEDYFVEGRGERKIKVIQVYEQSGCPRELVIHLHPSPSL